MTALLEDISLTTSEESKVNLDSLSNVMKLNGYTNEMIALVRTELAICKYRYYIGDDSGSMNSTDGNIIRRERVIQCTRYEEMKDGLVEAFDICSKSGIESYFKSLNSGSVYIKSGGNGDISNDHKNFHSIFYTPNGSTPLNATLNTVFDYIKNKPISERKKIVLYTDGESSDGDITQIIKRIQEYNTSITIRLCTNDSNVVTYWENIDKQLEVKLDIIEGYLEEKLAVNRVNPKLDYTIGIHKLRQFGLISNDFDRLDEAKLTDVQIEKLNRLNGTPDSCCCIC